MAKIMARVDFYHPKWESDEMTDVFRNGTDEEKRDWMLANGKCEAEEVNIGEFPLFYDEKLAENDKFFIYYADLGMIEEIVLVDFG